MGNLFSLCRFFSLEFNLYVKMRLCCCLCCIIRAFLFSITRIQALKNSNSVPRIYTKKKLV